MRCLSSDITNVAFGIANAMSAGVALSGHPCVRDGMEHGYVTLGLVGSPASRRIFSVA